MVGDLEVLFEQSTDSSPTSLTFADYGLSSPLTTPTRVASKQSFVENNSE